MQSTVLRDFIVGLFVLAGLASLGYLSLNLGGAAATGGGLELVATFREIGGLTERAPVAISGVRVGRVQRIELDSNLDARVVMDVDASLELPVDTSAAIRTAGLLGDQFIALEPGAEDDLLGPCEVVAPEAAPGTPCNQIDMVENALNIESLVGRLVHGAADGDEE